MHACVTRVAGLQMLKKEGPDGSVVRILVKDRSISPEVVDTIRKELLGYSTFLVQNTEFSMTLYGRDVTGSVMLTGNARKEARVVVESLQADLDKRCGDVAPYLPVTLRMTVTLRIPLTLRIPVTLRIPAMYSSSLARGAAASHLCCVRRYGADVYSVYVVPEQEAEDLQEDGRQRYAILVRLRCHWCPQRPPHSHCLAPPLDSTSPVPGAVNGTRCFACTFVPGAVHRL